MTVKVDRQTRTAIRRWARANLGNPEREALSGYETYERVWFFPEEHLDYMFRLMENLYGFWLILGTCDASYGANEDRWNKANFGTVRSVDSLNNIFAGLAWTREEDDRGK